jgi:putative transcriptional regulator
MKRFLGQDLAGQTGDYLDGQFLLAMPSMPDPRFARTVIYMCAHSGEGAMGIVVNKSAPSVAFPDLLAQLEIVSKAEAQSLEPAVAATPVLRGGPVETGRGFVLHSDEFHIADATLAIRDGVALTASLDILRAMARGEGPRRAILALGYASWAAGQLENEIQHNGWLTGPADPAIVFGHDQASKYVAALKGIGIDLAFLSTDAGRA